MRLAKFGVIKNSGDQRDGVTILDSMAIEVAIILDGTQGSILFCGVNFISFSNETEGGGLRGFRGANASSGKVFSDELV
jgi:hypothetical protein